MQYLLSWPRKSKTKFCVAHSFAESSIKGPLLADCNIVSFFLLLLFLQLYNVLYFCVKMWLNVVCVCEWVPVYESKKIDTQWTETKCRAWRLLPSMKWYFIPWYVFSWSYCVIMASYDLTGWWETECVYVSVLTRGRKTFPWQPMPQWELTCKCWLFGTRGVQWTGKNLRCFPPKSGYSID